MVIGFEDIERIAELIKEDQDDIMSACGRLKLDTVTVLKLREAGATKDDPTDLESFTYDELRAAEDEAEMKLRKMVLSEKFDPQRSNVVLKYLEKTKSRYRDRHHLRMRYEALALINKALKHIPKDGHEAFLRDMALGEDKKLLPALDRLLLHGEDEEV